MPTSMGAPGIWKQWTASGAWPRTPSLALDAFGRPHIAYYDASNCSLKYVSELSGLADWSRLTLPTNPARTRPASLHLLLSFILV